MHRAFSARTSLLQAAAKRAPIARPAGFNLQQQRFAHKVGIYVFILGGGAMLALGWLP